MNQEQQMKLMIAENKDLWDKFEFGQEAKAFLESRVGRRLIKRAEEEREEALKALVNTLPCERNLDAIRELQLTIRRAESIQYWMAEIIMEGSSAEETLRSMDNAQGDDE